MALTDKLTAIADAIRLKAGKTDGMTLEQMPEEIASIQGGEVDIPGVIKAGTYAPGETFTTGDNYYYIPMRFQHNGIEYSELAVEGLLGGIVTYVSADEERYQAGSRGSFTDRGEIVVLEDCDTRELSSALAEYDWFMAHYTRKDGQDYPVYDGEPLDITETELTDKHAIFKAETEPMIVDGEVAVRMNKNDLGGVMAEQVPEGYTFTSRYGINQVGKMPVYDYTPYEGHYYRDDGDNFVFDAPLESFVVLEDEVSVKVPKKEFGNTYPHMVVDGWEFTSAGGVKQKGTMPIYDYTPIEGSFADDDDDNLLFMATSPQQQVVEDELWISVPREDFGNAKPEDVAEGVTFTSAEGYRQVGTHKCSGGDDDTLNQLIQGTLTSFYSDQITHIRIRIFGYNNTLKEVELPNAKTMGMAAFASATALETVKLNSIETLVAGAQDQQFYGCSSLKNISMNSLKVVGAMSFDGCTSLKQVYLPSLTRVGGNGFIRSGLETAHFPVLSSIGTSAFASTKLHTLVLGGNAVVTLDNVSAFTGTPFASGGTGGTVYVKQALIPSYQTATNWSSLYAAGTCQFVAIEGSEYE